MKLADLDLNLLRAFEVVLAERSVTRAGARLGLTQPAMSNALARLRAALGDPLFVRTPAGMQPTPYALSLAEPVRQALRLLETAIETGRGFDPATADRLFRLYMSDIGEMVFLPPLLEALRRATPNVRVETRSVPQDVLAGGLATGEFDLAVGFLPGLSPPIESRRLFLDDYVSLFRADHPGVGERLTRKAFSAASHAVVSSIGSGHRVIEETLLSHGLNRRIALRVPHFMVVPMILERTDLLVTVPGRVAKVFEAMGRLRWLPVPVRIPAADVRLFWHERFRDDPANRWLRELLIGLLGR